jgi:hypothetical protein
MTDDQLSEILNRRYEATQANRHSFWAASSNDVPELVDAIRTMKVEQQHTEEKLKNVTKELAAYREKYGPLRLAGYYWVLHHNKWVIGEWHPEYVVGCFRGAWTFTGSEQARSTVDEVGDRINEPNKETKHD